MIKEKQIKYAKELDDVMVLSNELLRTIKNKADFTTLLDDLVSAVSGVTDIDDEFKANPEVFFQTIGYRVGEIPAIFMKKDGEESEETSENTSKKEAEDKPAVSAPSVANAGPAEGGTPTGDPTKDGSVSA